MHQGIFQKYGVFFEKIKLAGGDFGAFFKIDNVQLFTQIKMIQGSKIKFWRSAPFFNFFIIFFFFSNRGIRIKCVGEKI